MFVFSNSKLMESYKHANFFKKCKTWSWKKLSKWQKWPQKYNWLFFLEMVRFFHLLTCQLLRQVTFVLLRQKKIKTHFKNIFSKFFNTYQVSYFIFSLVFTWFVILIYFLQLYLILAIVENSYYKLWYTINTMK